MEAEHEIEHLDEVDENHLNEERIYYPVRTNAPNYAYDICEGEPLAKRY